MYKVLIISHTVIMLFMTTAGARALTEKEHLHRIKSALKHNDSASVNKYAREFFKSFPRSNYIAEVRLIMAEAEASPDEAVRKYRIVIDKYRFYHRRDYAQYKICEIYFLSSAWAKLRDSSQGALHTFRTSQYENNFRTFLVLSYIYLNDYGKAATVCEGLIKNDHRYENLARALLIMAYIHKKTTGHSRTYIYNLRELVMGFGTSSIMPSALSLLGDFYRERKMYNEAYSAYLDLMEKYPGSPESSRAAKAIGAIKRYKPKRVLYMPSKRIINNTETIDIRPEIDIPDEREKPDVFYSISIGPFGTLNRTRYIKSLLKDFSYIKTVHLRSGYILYVGKSMNPESALRVKIRLAEELGINGNIVRISGDKNRKYIYGE